MTGYEYENLCAAYLRRNGFLNVKVTKESGDQGIDVTATKAGKKYGIQCKLYSSAVGNAAVQQAYSGARYYDCDVAAVMTNQTFTKSAQQLAAKTNVELWGGLTEAKLRMNASSGASGSGSAVLDMLIKIVCWIYIGLLVLIVLITFSYDYSMTDRVFNTVGFVLGILGAWIGMKSAGSMGGTIVAIGCIVLEEIVFIIQGLVAGKGISFSKGDLLALAPVAFFLLRFLLLWADESKAQTTGRQTSLNRTAARRASVNELRMNRTTARTVTTATAATTATTTHTTSATTMAPRDKVALLRAQRLNSALEPRENTTSSFEKSETFDKSDFIKTVMPAAQGVGESVGEVLSQMLGTEVELQNVNVINPKKLEIAYRVSEGVDEDSLLEVETVMNNLDNKQGTFSTLQLSDDSFIVTIDT